MWQESPAAAKDVVEGNKGQETTERVRIEPEVADSYDAC
jgi:hypothetical protein